MLCPLRCFHAYPNHLFFVKEILIKGLFRTRKHVEHDGEGAGEHGLCPYRACDLEGEVDVYEVVT